MGFAPYFNRDIIALNKWISSSSDEKIKSILDQHLICVEFDEQYENSYEASCCIELVVRIIVRLYPKVTFRTNIKNSWKAISTLKKLSQSINSNIEFNDSDDPTIVISAVRKSKPLNKIPHFFIGSNGWVARFSRNKPLEFTNSLNPFGPGLTACIVTSNLLRFVFIEQLKLQLDDEVEFSGFTLSSSTEPNIPFEEVFLDDVTLVGVGAIGSSTIWALSKLKKLRGKINIVDHDQVEESNLQRYILLQERDKNKWKVDIANKFLRNGKLEINPVKCDWASFVDDYYDGKCTSRMVAVAVDSKEDRIYIQSSLPKKIVNAYTDESRIGITRHPNLITEVCLACLYVPKTHQKSKLELMAEELNLKGHEKFIFNYLIPGKLLDEEFLMLFSKQNNNIDINELTIYTNKSLGEFYLDMVCGYKMIEFRQKGQLNELVDIPLSFQSCMAGILLAAEVVIESLGIERENVKGVSQWNALDTLNEDNPIHLSYLKNHTKNCICGDKDYQEIYKLKWD